jgi:hypothetical protein
LRCSGVVCFCRPIATAVWKSNSDSRLKQRNKIKKTDWV